RPRHHSALGRCGRGRGEAEGWAEGTGIAPSYNSLVPARGFWHSSSTVARATQIPLVPGTFLR
ncbi:hypothetical protein, partial [Acetobacter syzygii]|uniref:hypothetical protein n=1 Tax=Acetobacter syzygii TaxID=146476 RepID=UPI001CA53E8A